MRRSRAQDQASASHCLTGSTCPQSRRAHGKGSQQAWGSATCSASFQRLQSGLQSC